LYFLSREDAICKADLSQSTYEALVVTKCDKAIDFGLLKISDKQHIVAVTKSGRLHLVDERGGSASGKYIAQQSVDSDENIATCCATNGSNLLAVAEWNSKKELAFIKLIPVGFPASAQPAINGLTQVKSTSSYSRHISPSPDDLQPEVLRVSR
jgi:hypothetical protein